MTAIKVKTASGWQDLSIAVPGQVAIEPWHLVGAAGEPAFLTGWTNLGAPSNSVGFRKTPDGRVQLRGVTVPASGANANAFILPVGYRPAATLYTPAIAYKPANGHMQVNCQIGSDGVVGPVAAQAAGSVVFPWGWMSFDGIEFPTDQASFPTGPSGADTAPRVTSLPSPQYDGQEIVYVADAANGVLWRLRYNAGSASAYKWEFVGGSALRQYVAAATGAIGVTGYAVMGGGPVLTLPLSGDYDVAFGAFGGVTAANYYNIAPAFLPAAAIDEDSIQWWGDTGNELHDQYREIRKTGLVGGNQVQLHMKVAAGTMNASKRVLWLRPVRVG